MWDKNRHTQSHQTQSQRPKPVRAAAAVADTGLVFRVVQMGSGSLHCSVVVWSLSKLHKENIFSPWVCPAKAEVALKSNVGTGTSKTLQSFPGSNTMSWDSLNMALVKDNWLIVSTHLFVHSYGLLPLSFFLSLTFCHYYTLRSSSFQSALWLFVFSQPIILSRWEAGPPLYNEGPGCPPDDEAPTSGVVRQQQTQVAGSDQQTGTVTVHPSASM